MADIVFRNKDKNLFPGQSVFCVVFYFGSIEFNLFVGSDVLVIFSKYLHFL